MKNLILISVLVLISVTTVKAQSSCGSAIPLTLGTAQCGTNSYVGSFPDDGVTAPLNPCSSYYNDGEYWFSFVGTGMPLQLSVSGLTDTYSGLFVFDNCPGASANCIASHMSGSSSANFVVTTPSLNVGTTYYIVLANWASPYSTSFCINSTVLSSIPNSMCAGADPFCTGSTYNFPAGVNAGSGESGPNYGCLGTQPNPVWYYLKIANAGDIMITMNSSPSVDIDFACWGPFSSPTTPCTAQLTATGSSWGNDNPHGSYPYPYGNLVDCSFDSDVTEVCYIPSGLVGQYYLLMITNYSNANTNIIFSQTSGSGATDCSIVAPPVGNNGPLCAGQTLNLTVNNPVGGATYAWTGPNSFTSNVMEPSIANVTTANAGTYSLVITVGGVSSAPVTTTVVVNPNPVVTPSATPATICAGSSTSLGVSSTVAGTVFSWTPGSLSGNPVSVSPGSTTTYTVLGTAAGCTGSNLVTVNVSPMVTPTFSGLGPYCAGASAAALPGTSNNSITGSWSPATINTTSAGNTVYTFTPTAGLCANTATMNVLINANVTPTFATLGPYCANATPGSFVNTSTNGITGTWSPLTINTSTPGSSTYTFTPTAGLCATTAPMNIVVNALDNPAFNYSPTSLCQTGSDVAASITGGSTGAFSASPAGLVFSNTSSGLIDVSASSIGSYTITFTTNGICPSNTTATVNIATTTAGLFSYAGPYCQSAINPTPTINPGSSAGTFSASPSGLSFVSTSTGQVNLSGSTPGTYTVTNYIAPSGGCAAVSETTSITINPIPTVTVPSNIVVCNNAAVTASNYTSTPAGGIFSWTNSNTAIGLAASGNGNIPGFTATNTGTSPIVATISVTPTVNGCQGTPSSYTITVNPTPMVNVPSNVVVCNNGTVAAAVYSSPTAGASLSWTNSNTSIGLGAGGSGSPNSFTASNTGTTPITATITVTPTANGCTGTPSTYTITVNPLPVITFPALPSICAGASAISLSTATPAGGTYSGSGVSSNTFNPSISGVGTFSITYTYTDGNSCTNSGTQTITVNASPTASFTVSPTTGCVQVPVTATYTGNGGAGASFNWNFAGGSATPGTGAGPQQITFSSAGTPGITLSVTENGCTSQVYTQNITIGQVTASTQVIHQVLCNGDANGQATVNPLGGATPYSYNWLTSPAQNTQNATGLAPGSYTVNITDAAGCTASSSVSITEPSKLVADIIDSTMINCYGDNTGMAEVLATGGTPLYQYHWQSSTSTTSQASNYYAGTYTVTVTDANACTAIVPFVITQNPQLTLSLNPTNEGCENSCNGSIVTNPSGGVAPYSYLWSPGSLTTQSITDLCQGTYSITVTDAKNCTITDNASITTNTIISAIAGMNPVTGIAPVAVNFTYNGVGGTIFTWDFGDGQTSTNANPIHTYSSAGTYIITLTVNSGSPDFCEDVFNTEIIIYPPSTIEIPNIFTPNGDGYNDVLKVKSEGLDNETMVIYNRWGRKVYEWNMVHGEWNGIENSGGEAATGVYYYIFDASGYDKKEYHLNGTVTKLQ